MYLSNTFSFVFLANANCKPFSVFVTPSDVSSVIPTCFLQLGTLVLWEFSD